MSAFEDGEGAEFVTSASLSASLSVAGSLSSSGETELLTAAASSMLLEDAIGAGGVVSGIDVTDTPVADA